MDVARKRQRIYEQSVEVIERLLRRVYRLVGDLELRLCWIGVAS
jgi:hypothetical protein